MAISECYLPRSPEQKSDPLKKKSSTKPSTSERDHGKVWEENIKLPERKRKQIPNPWE